jgi:hypothetical protein
VAAAALVAQQVQLHAQQVGQVAQLVALLDTPERAALVVMVAQQLLPQQVKELTAQQQQVLALDRVALAVLLEQTQLAAYPFQVAIQIMPHLV